MSRLTSHRSAVTYVLESDTSGRATSPAVPATLILPRPMKFGISYNTGYYGLVPDNLVACARYAEACGFESFYVPEHIVLHRGARLGGIDVDPALSIADPLEILGFVAASTQRILLGTGILTLPYHHPLVLAKRLATIDVLSRGRMQLLTVGLGSRRAKRSPSGSSTRREAVGPMRRSTSSVSCGPETRPA